MNSYRRVRALLALFLSLLVSCATLVTEWDSEGRRYAGPFSGTIVHVRTIRRFVNEPRRMWWGESEDYLGPLKMPFYLADLPLSLAVDTVILPWTLFDDTGGCYRRVTWHEHGCRLCASDVPANSAQTRTLGTRHPRRTTSPCVVSYLHGFHRAGEDSS